MKGRIIRITSLVLAIMMALSLFAACGNQKAGDATEATTAAATTAAETVETKPAPPELVELQFYFPGEAPPQMQDVLDEFYNRTKDVLNAKLVFNWVPWGDLGTKISLKIAAGEQVDSAFDAPWNTMPTMIGKDQYINLDSYFGNDEYPGLKKAFPAEYINSNKFQDKNGEYHVYGIPFTRTYDMFQTLYVRQDLREKYNLPEMKTLQDLETFLETVKANEKGMVPYGQNGGEPVSVVLEKIFDVQMVKKNTGYITCGPGVGFNVTYKEDGTPVLSGDDYTDTEYKSVSDSYLPAELRRDTWFWQKKAREWYEKGYTEKDIMNQKDATGFFTAGKFAAIPGDPLTYYDNKKKIESALAGAKIEQVIFYDNIKAMQPHSIASLMKAWNFACIPVTAKNPDRVMKVMDWMFTDMKNHDLIEEGIEGKHFVAVGDDKKSLPEGVDQSKNYSFPGYVLTWNPTMQRYWSDMSDAEVAFQKYMSDVNSFYPVKLTGFSFNAEPVKAELAKIGQIADNTVAVGNGLVKDIDGVNKGLFDKKMKLGLGKVREEALKQLTEYLKANPDEAKIVK